MLAKYGYLVIGATVFYLLWQNGCLKLALQKEQTQRLYYETLFHKSEETNKKLQILAQNCMKREEDARKSQTEREQIIKKAKIITQIPQGIIDENTRKEVIARLNRPL